MTSALLYLPLPYPDRGWENEGVGSVACAPARVVGGEGR